MCVIKLYTYAYIVYINFNNIVYFMKLYVLWGIPSRYIIIYICYNTESHYVKLPKLKGGNFIQCVCPMSRPNTIPRVIQASMNHMRARISRSQLFCTQTRGHPVLGHCVDRLSHGVLPPAEFAFVGPLFES